MAARDVCRLIVLGSTGSIGTQTLEVVEHLNALHALGSWPTRYEVAGLAAGKNVRLLGEQAKFGVRDLAIRHDDVRDLALSEGTASFPGSLLRARHGYRSALSLVREVECDIVVAAMSGVAGLPATLAAVELGRDVALANKETLVAAGGLVVAAAHESGAKLFPVDSEHSGVWQCLGRHEGTEARRDEEKAAPPMVLGDKVRRVVLTASGGPFRTWTRAQMKDATPEQALKHPTWSMGKKVTIDSASLMNKALEVIEAHWLFGLPPEKIGVLPLKFHLGAGNRRAVLSEEVLACRWVGADFKAGDIVLFPSLTVHKAMENHNLEHMRLSVDFRYQLEGEALTKGCLKPHFERVSWEDIYRDWKSDKLKYYWRNKDYVEVPWNPALHELPEGHVDEAYEQQLAYNIALTRRKEGRSTSDQD